MDKTKPIGQDFKSSKKKKGCILVTLLTLLFFLIILGISTCEDSNENQENPKQENVGTDKNADNTKKTAWNYSSDVNEMTGEKTFFAKNTSDDELDFEFPYQGENYGTLTIRNMNGKNEVIFSITQGQIIENYITLRFDEEKPIKVYFSNSADGSTETVFLNSSNRIIEKLKKAKTLKLQFTAFDNGNPILTFDVSNFEWKH